ncbi:phytanoyl-CoA dioxygenase family protein [Bacillus cereus]|uniref:phytanoyl-CoA dioxygenase family protein n=1 Tax=Bacillus cereus TaxID=1396 RepID=UPI000BFC7628|nr:phytanoyl-CoA dioxygenase family protein [Bacillus cereus]PGW29656.1 hypothetical protein COD88_05175 [Bacillus cereus]
MVLKKFQYNGSVTSIQKDYFNTWGFIIYQNFINEEEIEVINNEAQILMRKTLNKEIPKDDIDDLTPLSYDEKGNPFLHRLPYFTKYCSDTNEILTSKKIEMIGKGLLNNKNAWMLSDTMHGSMLQAKKFNKESQYKKIDWHIDFNENHILSPLVSLGIYLDDSIVQNGCLLVVPGSHNTPVSKFVPPALPIEVKAGDMVCHNGQIYHASTTPSVTEGIRRTLYLYCCGGAYPGKGLPFSNDLTKEKTREIFMG